MGTYYTTGASKADIIRELTEPRNEGFSSWGTLAKCIKGDVLWVVHYRITTESTNQGTRQHEVKWITCYLLKHDADGWGYKPLDEAMHPFYYSCPLSYLEMTEGEIDNNQEWRSQVREYHRRNNAGRKLEVGKRYALKGYSDPIELTSLRPLRGRYRGGVYKIKRSMVGESLDD